MATYLLQWEAIKEAMKRQCATYDFLGISADGKGKLAGVTDFKLRFNPEKKQWPQEQVIIYKPLMLFLLRVMSKIRKFFK
jgi:lipid II:glycine glycyltransferase (peptidoglycan interpeptide bridge formation enzyme)